MLKSKSRTILYERAFLIDTHRREKESKRVHKKVDRNFFFFPQQLTEWKRISRTVSTPAVVVVVVVVVKRREMMPTRRC